MESSIVRGRSALKAFMCIISKGVRWADLMELPWNGEPDYLGIINYDEDLGEDEIVADSGSGFSISAVSAGMETIPEKLFKFPRHQEGIDAFIKGYKVPSRGDIMEFHEQMEDETPKTSDEHSNRFANIVFFLITLLCSPQNDSVEETVILLMKYYQRFILPNRLERLEANKSKMRASGDTLEELKRKDFSICLNQILGAMGIGDLFEAFNKVFNSAPKPRVKGEKRKRTRVFSTTVVLRPIIANEKKLSAFIYKMGRNLDGATKFVLLPNISSPIVQFNFPLNRYSENTKTFTGDCLLKDIPIVNDIPDVYLTKHSDFFKTLISNSKFSPKISDMVKVDINEPKASKLGDEKISETITCAPVLAGTVISFIRFSNDDRVIFIPDIRTGMIFGKYKIKGEKTKLPNGKEIQTTIKSYDSFDVILFRILTEALKIEERNYFVEFREANSANARKWAGDMAVFYGVSIENLEDCYGKDRVLNIGLICGFLGQFFDKDCFNVSADPVISAILYSKRLFEISETTNSADESLTVQTGSFVMSEKENDVSRGKGEFVLHEYPTGFKSGITDLPFLKSESDLWEGSISHLMVQSFISISSFSYISGGTDSQGISPLENVEAGSNAEFRTIADKSGYLILTPLLNASLLYRPVGRSEFCSSICVYSEKERVVRTAYEKIAKMVNPKGGKSSLVETIFDVDTLENKSKVLVGALALCLRHLIDKAYDRNAILRFSSFVIMASPMFANGTLSSMVTDIHGDIESTFRRELDILISKTTDVPDTHSTVALDTELLEICDKKSFRGVLRVMFGETVMSRKENMEIKSCKAKLVDFVKKYQDQDARWIHIAQFASSLLEEDDEGPEVRPKPRPKTFRKRK